MQSINSGEKMVGWNNRDRYASCHTGKRNGEEV
jgi:hypothetical protein